MARLEDLVQTPVQYARLNLEEMKREGKILDFRIDGDTVYVVPLPAVPMIDRIIMNGKILNRCNDYTPTDHAPSLHQLPSSVIQ